MSRPFIVVWLGAMSQAVWPMVVNGVERMVVLGGMQCPGVGDRRGIMVDGGVPHHTKRLPRTRVAPSLHRGFSSALSLVRRRQWGFFPEIRLVPSRQSDQARFLKDFPVSASPRRFNFKRQSLVLPASFVGFVSWKVPKQSSSFAIRVFVASAGLPLRRSISMRPTRRTTDGKCFDPSPVCL